MKSTKLEAAIRAGDLEKVRKLIAEGADVEAAFSDGTKPIQLAAKEGQVTILRALAGAGAELSDLRFLDFEGRLRLFAEVTLDARHDDEDLMDVAELSAWALEAVEEQMTDEKRAAIADYEGPVFRAVRTGDIDLLRERIAAGDDVNQVLAVTQDSPLTQALQKRDEEIVTELIGAGADLNHIGYSAPLKFALPDLRLAKLLIDHEADLYTRGYDNRTGLEWAVFFALYPRSSEDMALTVRFFLETGIHPPSAETVEATLLADAQLAGAWELYQELLPHYPEEIAAEHFEELRFSQESRDHDGGFLHWTFDVKHAASEGDLDELRTLLATHHDGGAKATGEAVVEALDALPRPGRSRKKPPQLEAIRLLIEAGADLGVVQEFEPRRGSSPLARAAESWQGHSKAAMRLLIESGAEVDQRGRFDRTPLMFAIQVAYRHGDALSKAVPLLLEAGADPNLEDRFGLTAWSLAKAPLIEQEERERLGDAFSYDEAFFDGGDLSELMTDKANKADRRRDRLDRCREALSLLEAAGAKPHGEDELRLVMAATAGHMERLGELVAAGTKLDAYRSDGLPAIAAAAQNGHHDAVALLIEAGCDVDARTHGLPSALEAAVTNADEAMTRQLLDAGANAVMVACMGSNEAMEKARAAGATEVVEMVRAALPPQLANVERDVELEIAASDLTYESQRELPRHAALGDLDKVRELLAVDGVEIDGFDALCRTPLMAAAEAGQEKVVEELITLGADVDKCNGVVGSPRSTPLCCAAICSSARRDRILRLLLEAGAGPDRLGADGRTALMHAVERDIGFFGRAGEFALSTRTLIEAGADLEIRDPFGLTAWMRTMSLMSSLDLEPAVDQYAELAELLEEAGASTAGRPDVELVWAVMLGEIDAVPRHFAEGADPNARRHDGPTALILAVIDDERDIARMLIDAGCDLEAREWGERGRTAMTFAVEGKRRRMVRMLTEAGAKPAESRF